MSCLENSPLELDFCNSIHSLSDICLVQWSYLRKTSGGTIALPSKASCFQQTGVSVSVSFSHSYTHIHTITHAGGAALTMFLSCPTRAFVFGELNTPTQVSQNNKTIIVNTTQQHSYSYLTMARISVAHPQGQGDPWPMVIRRFRFSNVD